MLVMLLLLLLLLLLFLEVKHPAHHGKLGSTPLSTGYMFSPPFSPRFFFLPLAINSGSAVAVANRQPLPAGLIG
jgi:hypothetical protein